MFYLDPFGPDCIESYDSLDESQPLLTNIALRTLKEATLAEYPPEYVAGVMKWVRAEYESVAEGLPHVRELRSEADRQRRERFAEWARAVGSARQCKNMQWLWQEFGGMKEPVVISESALERYALSNYTDRWHLFSYEGRGSSVEDWDWCNPRPWAMAWLEHDDNYPCALVGNRSPGVPHLEPQIEGAIDTGPVPLNRFIWDRLCGLALGRCLSGVPPEPESMADALESILNRSIERRNELAENLTNVIARYRGIHVFLDERVTGHPVGLATVSHRGEDNGVMMSLNEARQVEAISKTIEDCARRGEVTMQKVKEGLKDLDVFSGKPSVTTIGRRIDGLLDRLRHVHQVGEREQLPNHHPEDGKSEAAFNNWRRSIQALLPAARVVLTEASRAEG